MSRIPFPGYGAIVVGPSLHLDKNQIADGNREMDRAATQKADCPDSGVCKNEPRND